MAASRVALNALALTLGVVFGMPFYWLVTSALKTSQQIFAMPPVWWPNPIVWDNFPRVFTTAPFGLYTWNTIQIAVPHTIGIVFSCTMAAYGFARIQWPGREILYGITLATLMIPGVVLMVPMFIIFRQLGWYGTYKPLIVPAFFGSAYYIFMLRQFFRTIPPELSEAARIDGASELGIFARIILPLAKPALAVVALFTLIGQWGDFMGPLIYINKMEQYTIVLGLFRFMGDRAHETDWGIIMAASTLMLLPVIAIFFFAQRTFIEGIHMTGLKG